MMKRNFFNSVRTKLFVNMCVVVGMLIVFLIIIASVVLESLYYSSKQKTFLEIYEITKSSISKIDNNTEKDAFINNLEKLSAQNNSDIVVLKGDEGIYLSNKNYVAEFGPLNEINYEVGYSIFNKSDVLYSKDGIVIRKINDRKNGLQYILLDGKIDENYKMYIRTAVSPIVESANISNRFILIIGAMAILLGGAGISLITERFTKPIEELNEIANEMSNLNFKRKYRIHDTGDEIDELGKSINTLSDKLEDTIHKLQINNSELEKDIEEKSKIDDMRKQFISDVSHELKTPIALIQGYAEGLVENVNSDEENRKFYSEVILDEANKMDKLVKRLLELMKLEYGDREFNDKKFDIVELINAVIKNSKVVLEEEKIEVDFKEKGPIWVYADDFYIEQVVTNFFTNAIKYSSEVKSKRKIRIGIKKAKNIDNYVISVFNTGEQISDENLNRIWTRFYKIDESRNRSSGGTGIGLALVRAIMAKYDLPYGVTNKKDGVEFYFEIKRGE